MLALLLSPILLGVIPRVKAWFAGRQGQPLFQVYYDLFRLFQKGAVYSTTTTWVFRLGPLVGLTAILTAMTITPMLGFEALISFSGDILLFAYLFALLRFFMIVTAMDTGSPFEGMGASREAAISLLNELALFLVLITLVKNSSSLSLSVIFDASQHFLPLPVLILTSVSLFVIALVENYRVPIDDPTTHLELTMIHEVMVLDNSGPDFGFILYTSSLKFWISMILLAQLVVPSIPNYIWLRPFIILGVMFILAIFVGVVESIMARLRLVRIPSLLVGVSTLALLGFILLS